jgi:hypothetical protein
MHPSARTNPHLRLTAAILVAMMAALAGSLDADGAERARRSEIQTLIGGLRLVSIPEAAPARSTLAAVIAATRASDLVVASAAHTASDRADLRALRRERLDASRASGAALLRTTALPPPIA